MKEIKISEIKGILNSKSESIELRTKLTDLFTIESEIKSILGLDIYKYSKYQILEQSLIPYAFKTLYNQTVSNCLKLEKFIFQKYSSENDFIERLIDTGDGGFQIFNNPIEAMIFAIYFQANLKRYNSFGSLKNLREIIGEITLRYALSTDSIFHFNKNYYGPAIINNARIMSKDKLNRFLIDDFTIKWFDKNIKGIENLQNIIKEDINKIEYFRPYEKNIKENFSIIFRDKYLENSIIKTDILRIGEIEAKGDSFSVYSFHCQVSLISPEEKGFQKYIISLGNLNASGL